MEREREITLRIFREKPDEGKGQRTFGGGVWRLSSLDASLFLRSCQLLMELSWLDNDSGVGKSINRSGTRLENISERRSYVKSVEAIHCGFLHPRVAEVFLCILPDERTVKRHGLQL